MIFLSRDPHPADDENPDTTFSPPLAVVALRLYRPDDVLDRPPQGPDRMAAGRAVSGGFGRRSARPHQTGWTTVRMLAEHDETVRTEGIPFWAGPRYLTGIRVSLLNLPDTLTDWLTYRIPEHLTAALSGIGVCLTLPVVHLAATVWWRAPTGGHPVQLELPCVRASAFDHDGGHLYGTASATRDGECPPRPFYRLRALNDKDPLPEGV